MSEDKVTIETKYYYDLLKKEDLLTELEEWLNTYKSVGYEDIGTFQVILDKIQELKEKYK